MFGYEENLKIGKVISIKGKKIIAHIFEEKNGPYIFIDGDVIKNVTVGSYVVIPVEFDLLIGKVEGEYAEEKNNNKTYFKEIDLISRKIEISVLGLYKNGAFITGLSKLPLIKSDVYIASNELIRCILTFKKSKNENEDEMVFVGNEYLNGERVVANINKLFASHIGIFGNTGSGKSYTLASLYGGLFGKYSPQRSSLFIFFDLNGEYNNCFLNEKTVVKLGENKFYIPKEGIFDDELWNNYLNASEKEQQPLLKETLNKFKRGDFNLRSYYDRVCNKYNEKELNIITKRILKWIASNYSEINYPYSDEYEVYDTKYDDSDLIYAKSIAYLVAIYNGTTKSGSINSTTLSFIDNFINNLKQILEFFTYHRPNDEYKNVIVIDMKNISNGMKKVCTLMITKRYYNLFSSRVTDNNTINIVIDEAHNILSRINDSENECFKEYRIGCMEEYIKEGRKFGVFLTIASQRPSDISSTFLSQTHNYFVHRLSNFKDIEALRTSLSFLDDTSFEMIPSLERGCCVFSGVATDFPVIVRIPEQSENMIPQSSDLSIIK